MDKQQNDFISIPSALTTDRIPIPSTLSTDKIPVPPALFAARSGCQTGSECSDCQVICETSSERCGILENPCGECDYCAEVNVQCSGKEACGEGCSQGCASQGCSEGCGECTDETPCVECSGQNACDECWSQGGCCVFGLDCYMGDVCNFCNNSMCPGQLCGLYMSCPGQGTCDSSTMVECGKYLTCGRGMICGAEMGCSVEMVCTEEEKCSLVMLCGLAQICGIKQVTETTGRPDNWEWWSVVAKGAAVKITAVEWRAFTDRINAFRRYKQNVNYTYYNVKPGDRITAQIVNQARDAIQSISPGYWGRYIPEMKKDDILTADYFNGIKNELNAIN